MTRWQRHPVDKIYLSRILSSDDMINAINTNSRRQTVYLKTCGCRTEDLTQRATKLAVTDGNSSLAIPCEKTQVWNILCGSAHP